MRYLKLLSVGLSAMLGVLAFVITATSPAAAVALPDIHVLSTGTYPLHLSFSDNKPTATRLSNELGGEFKGTGVLLLFLTFGLSSLGSFEVLFLKVLEPKTGDSCITTGDHSGEVLLKGSFHIVPTTTAGAPAILYLFAAFKLTCGPKTFKVSGAILTPIVFKSGSTESEDLTELCVVSTGNGAGKATATEYINDNGTKVDARLTTELGIGESESVIEVTGEICPEALRTSSGLINTFQILQR